MDFAKLDDDDVVLEVIIAEQAYVDQLIGKYVQSDPLGLSPKNAAGIGYKWRQDLNGFLPPQMYSSWVLNESSCLYEPPIAMPNDGNMYRWDEQSVNWVQV